MGNRVERWIVPFLAGFAPLVLALLTWEPSGGSGGLVSRGSGSVILAAEFCAILIAFGLRPLSLEEVRRLRPSTFVTSFLLLAIAVATALAVAPDPVAAWFRTGSWILHILFGVAVARLASHLFEAADLVAAYLAGFSAFVLLLVLFVLAVPDPAGFDWTRGWPAVTHIRHLGYYAGAMLGLVMGALAVARRAGPRALLLAVATVAVALAFWTGSRGTIAAGAAALVAGILFVPAMRRPWGWGGTLAAFALGAALTAALPVPADNMGFSRTVAATVEAGEGGVTTGRTVLWRTALDAIGERPLFGYGDGQMRQVATFSTMVQPHNALLQSLLAWGAVGTLLILFLAVPFLLRALAAVRRSEGAILPPFMAMLVLLAYAAFDGTLYHPLSLSIFAACAGLVASRFGPRPERARAPT